MSAKKMVQLFVFFQEKQYKKVCQIYEKISDDCNAVATFISALSYGYEKVFDKGLSTLLSIKKHANEIPDYYLYLALMYMRNGDLKKALYYSNKQGIARESELYYELKVEISLYKLRYKSAQYYINQAKKKADNNRSVGY